MGTDDEKGSVLFRGYRSLGNVCNDIPLIVRYVKRRRETLIVTVVGRVFHTYGGSKLRLLTVSKIHPENITATSADSFLVFAAAGKEIYAWRRGTELKHVYKGHHNYPVHLLLPFGPHLISIDKQSNLRIWDIKAEKCETEVEFPHDTFAISSLLHPATYVNKVLFGSSQGSLQLWNIRTLKRIYKFKGWNSPVLCLEQAPAVDVVAVGLESGEIYVHNLKFDETVVKFNQEWGSVTGLAFRTDGHPILTSCSNLGHIALWDLEKRSLSSVMRDAHPNHPITGLKTFQGEPLLLTSSPDNSLKQWIFDMTDGGGRLLRISEGHAKPPIKIRFYGAQGKTIISSSQDSSLRSFSTETDVLNRNFGVASYSRKIAKKHKKNENPVRMKPIIDFTTEITREKEWDNIACVHRSTNIVSTWSFNNAKMNEKKLLHPRFLEDADLRSTKATSLCLSVCGNFVLIGYESGHVDRFNLQSALHRGGIKAYEKQRVRSLVTDGLNQRLITASDEGELKFWSFKNFKFVSKKSLFNDISVMELQRDSNLLVCALEDFSIVIIDIITKELVRRFEDIHTNQITDISLSSDSRMLVSSSLDGSIKVADIPTGNIIDHFLTPTPAVSLAFSPKGTFLVTAHVDDLGLYLWSNVSLYKHVNIQPLSKDFKPRVISLPSMMESSNLVIENQKEDEEMMEVDLDIEFESPSQINQNLITLANLPSSRWQNLLSLRLIKERNKPSKGEIEKPVEAPFFLPTVSGLTTTFDLSSKINTDNEKNTEPSVSIVDYTEFGEKLINEIKDEGLIKLVDDLTTKGPSAIDIEITSLAPEGGGSIQLMVQFLKMIIAALKTNRNFESIQAYLGLFLKLHSDTIMEKEELYNMLEEIMSLQNSKWKNLRKNLEGNLTLIDFYKSSFC
ncbi:WD repeat-containing protein 36 [Lepeophtheirus salmonis]|uniref:WD repeat-containing protein 36 n=1 Tax=Lepeophtheirus salmonis TaxID=72036 RepID=UPI001AE83E85|nr:WD repeat-containing protein 36-like [Lepeophtheirus salmonis]